MKKATRLLLTCTTLFLAFAASVTYKLGTTDWYFVLGENISDARTQSSEQSDLSKLRILGKSILLVKDNYVDPDRIRPKEMLMSALDEVQRTVAEIVVSPSPGEDEEDPASITVTIGQRSRRFDVDRVESIFKVRAVLQDIYTFLQPHLGDIDVEPQRIQWASINGILSTLDPHSLHLDPDSFGDMQVSTRGKFGGLGIVISIRDGELTIISPIEDTPASRAGLKAEDRIVRIGDESTINMPLTEAVQRLRGDIGTDVDLYVRRKGWPDPRKFTLTRAEIKIQSVESRLLEDNVGYVKMKSFQQNTTEDLVRHLGRLKKEAGGEFKGLVLDLRNNPGGLLDQSIRVADTFLDSGTIVTTVGAANTLRDDKQATSRGTEERYPIVVLVNPGSASASEIVAGAVQNTNRGVVMGLRTFGKGSVQVLYELEDRSALKLTVAQYLTPGGVSIQSFGISPDISLVPVNASKERISITYNEREMREADLDFHLLNQATTPESTTRILKYYVESDEDEDPDGDDADNEVEESPEMEVSVDSDAFTEDFQIQTARKFIANSQSAQRDQMLAKAEPLFKKIAQAEEKKIQNALKGLGVDWGAGKNPADPQVKVKLESDQEGDIAQAGDKITLKGSLTNSGEAPLYRLLALSRSPNGHLDNREFVFGTVAPGETRTWEVSLAIPKEERTRLDPVSLEVFSGNNEEEVLSRSTMLLSILERDRPQFAMDVHINDTKGNNDGALQPGEEVTMEVTVHNIGPGASEEAIVSLSSKSGKKIYLHKGRNKLDNLKPGTTASAKFHFTVSDSVQVGDELQVNLSVFDTEVREWMEEKLTLRVTPPAKVEPSKAVVTANDEGVPVYIGADDTYPVVTRLPKGTSLATDVRTPDYYRVTQPDEAKKPLGWVRSNQVSTGAKKPDTADSAKLTDSILFSPPIITLSEESRERMLSTQDTFRLTATAEDDEHLKDYWIYVYTLKGRRLLGRKITYVPNPLDAGSPRRVVIDLPVPLKEGVNRILIYARDNNNMVSTQELLVYRPTPEVAADLDQLQVSPADASPPPTAAGEDDDRSSD